MRVVALHQQDWLSLPGPHLGQVHSTFARVANLSFEEGRWLSLVVFERRGPSRVHLDAATIPKLSRGARARVEGGILEVGGFSFSLNEANLYTPSLPKLPRAQVVELGAALASGWEGTHETWQRGERLAYRRGAALAEALSLGEGAALSKGLVGLGEGLTPCGDDLLTGMLAALQVAGAEGLVSKLVEAIVPALIGTTAISAMQLRFAATGEHEGALSDLFDGTPGGREEVVETLLEIGATSGRAMLGGVVLGARALRRLRR